jgi:hypothetical protein
MISRSTTMPKMPTVSGATISIATHRLTPRLKAVMAA